MSNKKPYYRSQRGRGRGRGGKHHDPVAEDTETPSGSALTDFYYNNDVIRISVEDAFHTPLKTVDKRIRERGRVFILPKRVVASDVDYTSWDVNQYLEQYHLFIVVERTIVGIDDPVYAKHKVVWENLSRGNARVLAFNMEKENIRNVVFTIFEQVFVKKDAESLNKTIGDRMNFSVAKLDVVRLCTLNGLRKFGYEDSKFGKENYENSDGSSRIEYVLALEKENGECGHATAFTLTDKGTEERFWFVGSKNVHIVLPFSDGNEQLMKDVLSCYNGMRYSYAKRIANLFLSTISKSGDIPSLHQQLQQERLTACFEAIFSDSQHLVDYRGKTEIRFFALSRCDETPGEDGTLRNASRHGLCEDVFRAREFYTTHKLYFSSINYGVGDEKEKKIKFGSKEYDDLIEDISKRHNSEGCVMYGFYNDSDSGAMNVCRIWKQKAYPYVMERAAREQIVNRKLCAKPLEKRLKMKLNDQPKELRIYFADWEKDRLPFLLLFSAYLQITKKITGRMSNDEQFAVRNNWLTLQDEFSKIYKDPSSETIELCRNYEMDEAEMKVQDNCNNVEVIKFIGAQGSGKSTLARAIFVLLKNIPPPPESKHGDFWCNPCWANQDECGGNRTKFLKVINQCCSAASKAGRTHLIIDKMNLDKRMNDDYKFLNRNIIATVYFYHTEGKKKLVDVLYDRVMGRGEGHRTIKIPSRTENNNVSEKEIAAKQKEVFNFISKAVSNCEKPDSYILGNEKHYKEAGAEDIERTLLELDVTIPLEEMLILLWEKMKQNSPQYSEIMPSYTLDEDGNCSVETKKDIQYALFIAKQYELYLSTQPQIPLYACIRVKDPDALLKLVPDDLIGSKIVQNGFHITTKYFVDDADPIYLVKLSERNGKEIDLRLKTVLSDDDGICVVVDHIKREDKRTDGKRAKNEPLTTDGFALDDSIKLTTDDYFKDVYTEKVFQKYDFPCQNNHPHITIGNRKGIPPRYSNDLCEKYFSTGGVKAFDLPENTVVKGVFEFR